VVALIGSAVWFYFSPAISTLSPHESALNETRQLLSAVAQNTTGPMPKDLPGYLRVNEDCWTFLQQSMNKNANQFKLTVKNEYNSFNDPNSVHQLIEVWINIDFPDGQRAEMYYSQGGLSGCHPK
jgi:hypothetical protein